MAPNISLIIPVHNAEPFLERCLDSATAQTVPELEIICINDASTDASRDILEAYASRDRRIRVAHREVNGGESAARNQGLALARGEYLAFLDHDDMLEPDALRVLYERAQASGSDIVRGRVKTVDYAGQASLSPLQLHADICHRSRFYFHIDWWSATYRASLVQGKFSFAEEYPIGGDMLFLTEALLATPRVTCVDDLVYTHFLSPESGASRVFSPEKVSSTIAAYTRIIKLLHQHNIDTTDYIGYSHKFVSLFDNVVHLLAARCPDDQSRLACCDFLFAIKNMHRHPEDLLNSLQMSSAYLKPLLASGDPEGLRSIIKRHQDLDAKAFAAVFFPTVFRQTISQKLSSKHPKKCENDPHFPFPGLCAADSAPRPQRTMPMKVCLYISVFAPGGAERQMVHLACELADRGLQVFLLHAKKSQQDAPYLQAIKSRRVKLISALSPEYLKEGIRLSKLHEDFFRNIPAPSSLRMGILYLAGAFSLLRPHIVHSYLDMPNCTAGCAAVLADVPAHLASFHNYSPATGHFPWEAQTYPLYRYLILHARPNFEACSRASVHDYARWLDLAPETVAYMPNGLDPAAYLMPTPEAGQVFREAHGIPPDAPVILILSRFVPYKAPESIVDIYARVHARRPDCHFLVGGTGMAADEEMGTLAREHGLDAHLHLLGVQSDVAPLFACADIFLLPSKLEGFPISIMEAMAMEVPVVASAVGGVPDLVRHGMEGFLHDAADLEGMAQSVVTLVDDAALRARQGRAGRQRILEEFSLQKMGDRAVLRYEELLQKASREMP